jgi:hypothetical protein
MAERSLLATVLGLPPWGAVALAAVLTTVGTFVDLVRIGSLGAVFTVCFATGCVLAVAWVRRRGLFGPMVQPPLLVAVAVPTIVLLAGSPDPGAGVAERLLVIGAPLVNAFPIMAWTTGGVLALGLLRILVQRPLTPVSLNRRPPAQRRDAVDEPSKPPRERRSPTAERRRPDGPRGGPVSGRRPPAEGAAREEAQRSRSPRRS